MLTSPEDFYRGCRCHDSCLQAWHCLVQGWHQAKRGQNWQCHCPTPPHAATAQGPVSSAPTEWRPEPGRCSRCRHQSSSSSSSSSCHLLLPASLVWPWPLQPHCSSLLSWCLTWLSLPPPTMVGAEAWAPVLPWQLS